MPQNDNCPGENRLMYYSEFGFGPPLLLIHGIMATGSMFDTVLTRLAAGRRVILPDLRGHGKSRHMPPPYDVARLASDISLLLSHLGLESASVLGYSEGGAVAQQFAMDYPDKCNRLILTCTYAHDMATLTEWAQGKILPYIIRAFGLRPMANLIVSLGTNQMDANRVKWLEEMIGSQDQELMVEAWKQGMAFDSRSRLAEIKCPTLIIAGSLDNAVPIHHAHTLNKSIAGSRLVVIEGADHTLIWTRPQEFVSAVTGFLGY